MTEWLWGIWESLTWSHVLWGLLVTVVTILISYGLIVYGIVKIPADYFSSTYVKNIDHDKHFSKRWAAFLFKNIVGFVMIVAGVVMIFTPGPGVPTILLGLIMMDIPGKRPLEAKLVQRPAVLAAINHLRSRYNKPPLILD